MRVIKFMEALGAAEVLKHHSIPSDSKHVTRVTVANISAPGHPTTEWIVYHSIDLEQDEPLIDGWYVMHVESCNHDRTATLADAIGVCLEGSE